MMRKRPGTRGVSNLNRQPRMGEFTTLDQLTGLRIWNTDAALDYWNRIVHKDNVMTVPPFELPYTIPYEPTPDFGSAPGEPNSLPGRWLYDPSTGAVWFSTSYSPGQYPFATPAQIAARVPVVNDQSYNYPLNIYTHVGALVATLAYSDPAGDGVFWAINSDPTSCFSINSATGELYIWNPSGLDDSGTYEVGVTLTSYSPGQPSDTAIITITMIEGTIDPEITTTSPVSVAENQTAVVTMTAVDNVGGGLTWSITGGADSAEFNINASSGLLSFNVAKDYETDPHSYVVEVTVTDTAMNTDSLMLTVNLTDVTDTPGAFGSVHTWLDFNDASTITLVSSEIQQIDNKITAVGGNFAAAVSTSRPAVTTAYFGGRSAAAVNNKRLDSSLAHAVWKFLGDSTGATVVTTIRTRQTSGSGQHALLGNDGVGSNADAICQLSINASNNINATIANGGAVNSSPSPTYNFATEYVIAYRFKSGSPNIEMFLNGVSVGSGAAGSDTGTPNSALVIFQPRATVVGGNATVDYWMTELVIYNEALSDPNLAGAVQLLRDRSGI